MQGKGGNGGKGAVIQQQVRINLNEMPTVGCPNCGCLVFATNVSMYKKLSAIQMGKPMLAKIELSLAKTVEAWYKQWEMS